MIPYYQRDNVTIYCSTFTEAFQQLAPGSVSAVIADPPYPRAYLPLWWHLAIESERLLERGGSLLSLVPHYALPDVLQTVTSFLKYRWIVAMIQSSGAHPRMAMGIEVTWKPLLWWVKGAWPTRRGFRVDSFQSDHLKASEKLHKWQQCDAWANYCLDFVPAGGLVVDPMMGSGTVLEQARTRGYPVIGIDSDEAACALAAKRLEEGLRTSTNP